MKANTIRLDKFLANRGVCARRAVEKLLVEKIVTINGIRAMEAGIRINPASDSVLIGDKDIRKPELKYYLLNKPKGYVSTTSDTHAPNIVTSLIKTDERIFPVGRLDKHTTGLLILTNDGEFTNLLTHPRYHIPKTYHLTINGALNQSQLDRLKNGVELDDGMTFPAEVKLKSHSASGTSLEMTIHEGRNRQIRRMCNALKIDLKKLERVAIGPIKDPKLPLGKYKELTLDEIESLKEFHNLKIFKRSNPDQLPTKNK